MVNTSNIDRKMLSIVMGVVTILVISVMAGGIAATVTDTSESDSFNQQANTTYVVFDNGFETNATSVADGGPVTVELSDEGSTTSVTLNSAGDSQNVTLSGGEVQVTLDSASSDSATLSYESSGIYGGGVAGGLIPIAVGVGFLFLVLGGIVAAIRSL